jgi:alkanesulfonate monooxygenase SsuD/methylene tetrahydromethanopterin reductase-like flavin-dependent oxidoreductase (luciferase family)
VQVALGDDVDACRATVKPILALYVGGMGARGKNFYNDLAKRLGYEEAAVAIQDFFLDGKKGDAVAAVPDALVDELFLIGTEDRIRDRLGAWREAGRKRQVDTMQIATTQPEALELLAKELL